MAREWENVKTSWQKGDNKIMKSQYTYMHTYVYTRSTLFSIASQFATQISVIATQVWTVKHQLLADLNRTAVSANHSFENNISR